MKHQSRYLGTAAILLALGALSAAPVARAADTPAPAAAKESAAAETGLAAVYSSRLNGHTTASGERYDGRKLTAAHKTLPFGTQLRVTHAKSHRSVVVRVNDRGPTQAGRILDISPAAARALGIRPTAMAEVSAVVVGHASKRSTHRKG